MLTGQTVLFILVFRVLTACYLMLIDGDWSVISKPALFLCFVAQDCLQCMQSGSELIKVRSNSRQYHRIFTLNPDMTEIRWQPTSKKPHKARSKYAQVYSKPNNTIGLRYKSYIIHVCNAGSSHLVSHRSRHNAWIKPLVWVSASFISSCLFNPPLLNQPLLFIPPPSKKNQNIQITRKKKCVLEDILIVFFACENLKILWYPYLFVCNL